MIEEIFEQCREASREANGQHQSRADGEGGDIPILSSIYGEMLVDELPELPSRAKRFKRVVDELAAKGVEWFNFSRITVVKKVVGDVNTGLQATGKYDDKFVIFATKVGVMKPSAGNLISVGTEDLVRNSATASSTGAALEKILQRLEISESKDTLVV